MILPKPIWKDIVGFENHYQINQFGQIRTLKYNRVKGNRLSTSVDKDGYLRVRLQKNNQRKRYGVHRLVALTFIPNPHNYPVVNHINENKKDNRVENLEWCTIEYNNNYGSRHNNYKKPCVIDGLYFESQTEASKYLKVDRHTIDNWIKKGRGYYK